MRFPLQRLALAFSVPLVFSASALAQGYEDEWQPPAALALFSGSNFTGEVREAFDPIASMHELAFNDRPRSVAVLAGQWELCEHHNFTGRCVFLREDVADLGWFGLNNHISSVRPIFEYTEAQHGLMFSRDDYGFIRYAHNESYGHGDWNHGYSSSVRISLQHYGYSPDYIRYGYYDPRWGYDPYGFAWSGIGRPRYVSYTYRVHPRPVVINNYWRTNWASSHPKWHRRGHRDDWRRSVDWRADGRDHRDHRGRPDNRRRDGDFAGRGGGRDDRLDGRGRGTDGPGNRRRLDDRRRDGDYARGGGDGDGRRGGDFAGRGGEGEERPDGRRPGRDRREEGRPGNRGTEDGRTRTPGGGSRSVDAGPVPGTRGGALPSGPRRGGVDNPGTRFENRGGPGRPEGSRADRAPRPDTGAAPGERGPREGRSGGRRPEQTGTPPARGPSVRTVDTPPVTATSPPQGRQYLERGRGGSPADQTRAERNRSEGLMGGPRGGGDRGSDGARTRGPSSSEGSGGGGGRGRGAAPERQSQPQPAAAPSQPGPSPRGEGGGRRGDGGGLRGGGDLRGGGLDERREPD